MDIDSIVISVNVRSRLEEQGSRGNSGPGHQGRVALRLGPRKNKVRVEGHMKKNQHICRKKKAKINNIDDYKTKERCGCN